MKTPIRLAAALALLAAVPGPGLTQPRAADPEGTIADELVVRAHLAGPAWWTVTRGGSTVWILGVPAGLPKGVAWSEAALRTRLEGARALILPPGVRLNPFTALTFFITHRTAFKSRAPLEPGLPPQMAARFAADREKLGKDARRYASWRPVVAGVMLDGDVRAAAKIQLDEPRARIRALGRRAGVRELAISDYDLTPMLKVMASMSERAHLDCLDDALDQADAGPDQLLAAGRAWAEGDVRGALRAQRGSDKCLAALPDLAQLLDRRQAETAEAIRQALAGPGHTVAVVELRSLLARGGVLDRLKANGFAVQTPDRDR